MRRCFIALLALAFVTLISAGCKDRPATVETPSSQQVQTPPKLPTEAQGQLQTMKLFLGNEEMPTELALNEKEITTGMMFRTNLAENAGMLFVFAQPYQVAFWMKNCPLPLSAAYIGPDGTILEIRKLEPFNTNSVVAVSANVQYVIEANDGYFERKHIPVGTLVRTDRGSLPETFFTRR